MDTNLTAEQVLEKFHTAGKKGDYRFVRGRYYLGRIICFFRRKHEEYAICGSWFCRWCYRAWTDSLLAYD